MTHDDNELLRRCQTGDGEAFDLLLRRFESPIYRLALRVIGDADLAHEATAIALAKVWAKVKQWRGDSSAGTWIYRLALRTILDVERRQRRWWNRWSARLPKNIADGQPTAEDTAAQREERSLVARRVHEAVAKLTQNERALVHLYYFEDRKIGEIADIVSSSPSAVKMRLLRVRQRLREMLEDLDESL